MPGVGASTVISVGPLRDETSLFAVFCSFISPVQPYSPGPWFLGLSEELLAFSFKQWTEEGEAGWWGSRAKYVSGHLLCTGDPPQITWGAPG